MIELPTVAELITIITPTDVMKAATVERPIVFKHTQAGETKTLFILPFLEHGQVEGIDVFYFDKPKDFAEFRSDGILAT